MSMNENLKFVLVDDDEISNMIYSMVIEDALGGADIQSFTEPEEGLAHIQNIKGPTILFLDINMPTLTCWEFLEQYEKFSEDIKARVKIFILSSSIDYCDRDKAAANKYVQGFLSKPLQSDTVISIVNENF